MNVAGIRAQLERFLDFEPGSGAATMVNNLDWLGGISMLDFLRDVGKHFTVPYMLAKDSVPAASTPGSRTPSSATCSSRRPTSSTCTGRMGVEAQVGGADQWGNITAGLELIRKTLTGPGGEPAEAYALSYPLLLDPSGAEVRQDLGRHVRVARPGRGPRRMRSTSSSWTGRIRTSASSSRLFTIMDRPEIEALEAEQAAHPELRPAQRALALDLTTRVHGVAETERAVRVSQAVFGEEPSATRPCSRRCTTCSTTAT